MQIFLQRSDQRNRGLSKHIAHRVIYLASCQIYLTRAISSETSKADTHVLEVRNRDIQHVLQPPCRIEVIDHLVVLLDKRLVDRQRFLSVRLDHLKVMFYERPAKVKVSMTFAVSFSSSFSSGPRDG